MQDGDQDDGEISSDVQQLDGAGSFHLSPRSLMDSAPSSQGRRLSPSGDLANVGWDGGGPHAPVSAWEGMSRDAQQFGGAFSFRTFPEPLHMIDLKARPCPLCPLRQSHNFCLERD